MGMIKENRRLTVNPNGVGLFRPDTARVRGFPGAALLRVYEGKNNTDWMRRGCGCHDAVSVADPLSLSVCVLSQFLFPRPIIWAALIDFVVVSALATVFFFYFEKRGNIYRSLIWALVATRIVALIRQVHSSTSWPASRLWQLSDCPGVNLFGRCRSLEVPPTNLRGVGQGICGFDCVSGIKRTMDCA